jgi:hypothetical protein
VGCLLLSYVLWHFNVGSYYSCGMLANAQVRPQPNTNKNDSCVGAISLEQYTFLYDLYSSTGGYNWIWDDSLASSTIWHFPSNLTDPCTNQWQGLNCSVGEVNCEVTSMILANRGLAGPLPNSVANMSSLIHVYLNNNKLTNTLPVGLSLLTNAKNIFLYNNMFSGSIPTALFTLTKIEILEIYENQLTSTIPTNVGGLLVVQVLGLVQNYLTGKIPGDMDRLTNLLYLYLYSNYLSAELPLLTGLQNVTYFGIQENMLSSTLPSWLGSISSITQLNVGDNMFWGTLPSELGGLPLVQNMEFHNNYFTGVIPPSFGENLRLFNLVVNTNQLSGPIPSELSNCYLGSLETENNLLSGPLPSALAEIRRLESINVGYNYLTGRLSPAFATCTFLKSILFNSNYISGSVPPEWNVLPIFMMLNGSSNLLSGNLSSLFPDDNICTGCIIIRNESSLGPQNRSQLPMLQSFSLSSNELSGQVPASLFSSPMLQTVVLYSNCFSGSLDDRICDAFGLTTLIMDSLNGAKNCEVRFPMSLGNVFKGFISRGEFKGTIPQCIWSMPSLGTLHLSSNGLHGTIGEIDVDSSMLKDVTLVSNNLVGSLPVSFQTYGRFVQLDLSFNKLSGKLSSSFAVNDSNKVLDLTVNRFSGQIPGSLMTLTSLNILEGNLFQCQNEHKPSSDPNSKQYQCGATNLNEALYLWFAFFVVMVLLITAVYYAHRFFVNNLLTLKWLANTLKIELMYFQAGADSGSLRFTAFFAVITSKFFHCAVRLTALFVSIAMVAYILLKLAPSLANQFSTHTEQYTWVTTAAYLHGFAPVLVVVGCLWWAVFLLRALLSSVLSLSKEMAPQQLPASLGPTPFPSQPITPAISLNRIVMAPLSGRQYSNGSTTTGGAGDEATISAIHSAYNVTNTEDGDALTKKLLLSQATLARGEMDGADSNKRYKVTTDAWAWVKNHRWGATWKFKLRPFVFSMGLQLFNVGVTLIVNVAYVYAIFQGLSFWSLSIVQLMLGVYKLVWVNGVMSMLIRKLEFLTQEQKLLHRSFMSMFTFIAGPFLATFFSDSTCFRYLVTGPPSISSSFETDLFGCEVNCVTYLGCLTVCAFSKLDTITVNTVVVPGWLYSYQCFSALLSNYVPVLVLSFLLSGIIFPAIMLVYLHLTPEQVEMFIPNFVREVVLVDTIHMHVHMDGSGGYDMQQYLDRVSMHRATIGQALPNPNGRPLFNSDIIVTKLLLNVTMLLTFGLSSPLFALIVCVDAFSTNMLWRILIGRYLRMWASAQDENMRDMNGPIRMRVVPKQARRRLERATRGAGEGLELSLMLVVLFAGLFWSLAVFDYLGDQNGAFVGGLCTMLSWCALPLLYWATGFLPSSLWDWQWSCLKDEDDDLRGAHSSSLSLTSSLGSLSGTSFSAAFAAANMDPVGNQGVKSQPSAWGLDSRAVVPASAAEDVNMNDDFLDDDDIGDEVGRTSRPSYASAAFGRTSSASLSSASTFRPSSVSMTHIRSQPQETALQKPN